MVSPIVVVIIVLVVLLVALVAAFLLLGRRPDERFKLDIGGGVPTASGGSDTSSESGFKARLSGLNVFSGSILAILLTRLWSMQLVSQDEYSAQAERNRTRTISVTAPRGRILDRNGKELVTNRASLCVVAKSDVADNDMTVTLLANLIGMPATAVRRNIQDATGGAQSMRTVAQDVSRRVVAYVEAHPHVFPDVEVVQRTQRLYPKGSLAAHVLGYTGAITSDQVKAMGSSEDGSITYELGDTVGQAGVEYEYESVLQGVKGEQNVYVDADGNVLSYASSVDPRAGSDVTLTIDADIQAAAEQSLSDRISKLRAQHADCNGGSCIAMDVTSGEVLAMASYPTYSPNIFVGGISADDWDALSSDAANNPLLNRAISGQYPSASTIKPLTALAALKSGIATPESSYYCTGYWTGFGSGYGQYCWKKTGHGAVNVQTGITYSCDVVFYEIGKGFYYSDDPEALQDTLEQWGLGSREGIDLPNEGYGRVPTPAWKEEYFSSSSADARAWQGGDDTNLAIGQGDLLVTPLQMTCVYAGLALKGTVWKPHLLKSVRSDVGSGSVIAYKNQVNYQIDVDETYIDLVHAGLKGVIYDESEAQASHFTNLSVQVAGKTGTAEVTNGTPTGWFVAYCPIDNPQYVVAANIEHSGYGSEGALYVVRDVLGTIYGEPDTSTAVDSSGVR